MNFLNSSVRIVVVAFVFIAGAITLAGPESSVTPNDAPIKSATPVVEEHDLAEAEKAEAAVALQAHTG